MSTTKQYNNCNKKGLLGEQACYSLCRQILPIAYDIKDTRDIPEFQEKDIDFVIDKNILGQVYIEAKYAGIDGGADVFETIKNTTKGTLGWALGSQAHYVTIYKEPLNEIHIINMALCRPFIEANMNNPKYKHYVKKIYSIYNEGQVLYATDNIRIPYKDLKDNKVIAAIFSYRNNSWEQTYIS